jgi:hypothetical protein
MEEELKEKAQAQHQFCLDKSFVRFAPWNGICPNCKQNIYQYISLNEASNTHITECPLCNKDYCD